MKCIFRNRKIHKRLQQYANKSMQDMNDKELLEKLLKQRAELLKSQKENPTK